MRNTARCEKCKKFVRKGQRYCKSCLAKIHIDETVDESGQVTKRCSVSPPGVGSSRRVQKCAKCKKISRKAIQYGKRWYCKSCLKKIHAKEDADEAAGKSVKRYISEPPPGIKIKT